MSNALLNAAWKVDGLSPVEKLVLVRLADHANDKGTCFPGQTGLAKQCCTTVRTVRLALNSLKKAGHVSILLPATWTTSATYIVTPQTPVTATGGVATTGEEAGAETPVTATGPSGQDNRGLRLQQPPNPQLTTIEPKENPKNTPIPPLNVEGPDSPNGLLEYLNEVSGRQYRPTETNLNLIRCRLAEVKGDAEGIRKTIWRMNEMWRDDPKMSEFIRPETLFGKTKFGSYYDNRDLPVRFEKPPMRPQDWDRPAYSSPQNRFVGNGVPRHRAELAENARAALAVADRASGPPPDEEPVRPRIVPSAASALEAPSLHFTPTQKAEAFQTIWRKWVAMRSSGTASLVDGFNEQTAFQEQLDELGKYRVNDAVEIVAKSVRNQWRNLSFEGFTHEHARPMTPEDWQ